MILPVEDEKLILSSCGDDDRLGLFPEQLPSPTSMQLRLGTTREEFDAWAIGIAVQRQECHCHVMKEREALESSRPWKLRQKEQRNPGHH